MVKAHYYVFFCIMLLFSLPCVQLRVLSTEHCTRPSVMMVVPYSKSTIFKSVAEMLFLVEVFVYICHV